MWRWEPTPGRSSRADGVSYGDSYVVDPFGEIVVRSRHGREDLIFCDMDLTLKERGWQGGRSLFSFRQFAAIMQQAVASGDAFPSDETPPRDVPSGNPSWRTDSHAPEQYDVYT